MTTFTAHDHDIPNVPGFDSDALSAAIKPTASRVLICYGTTITAESPGLCPRCGTRWSEGDLIWCDSALALPKWQHAECPPKEQR